MDEKNAHTMEQLIICPVYKFTDVEEPDIEPDFMIFTHTNKGAIFTNQASMPHIVWHTFVFLT